MVNLKNDENSTFHKIQKQNLILLPETHTIYYKELHTAMGLRIFHQNLFQGCPDRDDGSPKFGTQFFTNNLTEPVKDLQ